ncbi:MFS transporter [Arcobacter peruensis]|uniref:MFS transporter n=1 Tax=Arcobacter peruensis TaxID=2320140 RepID=UPI000F088AE0|nr:MFS transporter [Arcobacter peruensis]
MKKHLFPLALGGLAIGTTEFAVMGLLPDISTSLNVSIPIAGYLISAYAFGVVVGAPTLVALSAKFKPKYILIALMIMFTVFNALSIIAPDYTTLLVTRFLSGLPHGAFFGVATVVASKLAKEGKAAQDIASIFTGLTLAILLMVPLVTYLGHNLNWRYAFVVVTILGLLTIFYLHLFLPNLDSLRTITFKEELEFFKTIKAWHILTILSIGFAGLFAWFSYIAPLLINISGFDVGSVSYMMVVAGFGMVVGNIFGGYLADKKDPVIVSIILLALMVVSLILVFLYSENKIMAIILTFLCGALATSISSPINMIMLKSAKHSQLLGAAFIQAGFNVANSLGAFLGGIPLLFGYAFNYPSLVGAAMAFIGMILCMIFYKRYKNDL